MGDRSVFQPIHPWLNGDTLTYCFADPRGYGGSRDVTGDYTLEEVGKDAIALTDSLGWERFTTLDIP